MLRDYVCLRFLSCYLLPVACYYRPMPVAVILVILTVMEEELRVLLIHRSGEPFLGWWALPGGLLRPGEPLSDAAGRKLVEETGVADVYLEQLFTFDRLEGETVAVA